MLLLAASERLMPSDSEDPPPDFAGDAEIAAALWTLTRAAGLSFGDRSCLALASRLGVPVLTTDRAWAKVDVGVPIELIR